ncbi:DgyrCDS11766 [Dimorphilus gyrociliatus]|uniref:DgyrCDS11766 n=1 Tax=Dimorphilus gyrociliatus TaxID=2664684 RepID=A0A7I8W6Y4_9ANNE|nr:DgyrCDS11766 [Dimorphilus gyrociliatus]
MECACAALGGLELTVLYQSAVSNAFSVANVFYLTNVNVRMGQEVEDVKEALANAEENVKIMVFVLKRIDAFAETVLLVNIAEEFFVNILVESMVDASKKIDVDALTVGMVKDVTEHQIKQADVSESVKGERDEEIRSLFQTL